MLFGTITSGEAPQAETTDELRICSLNVNSPSRTRAERLATWLLATESNTLVLTELQPSEAGRHLLACLTAEGFTIACTPGWTDTRYFTAIATRGITAKPIRPASFDPRVVAVDIRTDDLDMRLVGAYGLTNGMTAESSQRRKEFQRHLLDYLAQIHSPSLCVTGDLNVVEPNHQPPLPAFEEHDYALYTGLLALGLRDAYRQIDPSSPGHSWINDRFGGQRLDHCLVRTTTGAVRSCAYDHAPRHDGLSDHAAMLTVIAADVRSTA
jgi:exonuclease III